MSVQHGRKLYAKRHQATRSSNTTSGSPSSGIDAGRRLYAARGDRHTRRTIIEGMRPERDNVGPDAA